jgi:hypothetical protein
VIVVGTNAGAIVPASPRRSATGTSGALLSSDDYGSSVERTAKLHPLWRAQTDAAWFGRRDVGVARGEWTDLAWSWCGGAVPAASSVVLELWPRWLDLGISAVP